ncbi:hypothetical protein [Williamsia soli]|uniref:hypothetical protein n=1 Tax=Williamsia soli TaxID=364929 RepID=UPI001F475B89|nr:hypothetical protein [Williamsia soli]
MNSVLTQVNTHLMIVIADGPTQPQPAPPPGSDKFLTIVSWVGWGAMLVAILALVVAGARFGFQKSHGGATNEEAGKVGWTLVGCVLIAIAGSLVGALVG